MWARVRPRWVSGRGYLESRPRFRGEVPRRLARQTIRDPKDTSLKAVAQRHGVSWWQVMPIVNAHAGKLEEERRWRRRRALTVDEYT